MPLFPALEVHAASYQDVELDSKYDFEKAFQKALDVARDSEDKNTIYRIKIPAGTYKAGSCFNVYSNTYIDMEGVTLIRTSGSSMFRFGRSEDVKKISGYTGFKILRSMAVPLTARVHSMVINQRFCDLHMQAM